MPGLVRLQVRLVARERAGRAFCVCPGPAVATRTPARCGRAVPSAPWPADRALPRGLIPKSTRWLLFRVEEPRRYTWYG